MTHGEFLDKIDEYGQDANKLLQIKRDIPTTLLKGASNGDADVQYYLGLGYLEGRYGLEQNHAKAVEMFKMASEQMHAMAYIKLAECYLNAFGVVQNFDEMNKCYACAAKLGNPDAIFTIKHMVDGIDDNEKAYEQVLSDFASHITLPKNKYTDAERKVAYDMMIAGKEYSQDNIDKAVELWRKAASMGDPHAHVFLVKYYIENDLKNPQEIVELLKFAAKENIGWAQFYLGACYMVGFGVDTDYAKMLVQYVSSDHPRAEIFRKALGL